MFHALSPVRLLRAGLLTALAASVWALVAQDSCDACRAAVQLVGGWSLGWAGVPFYALLLLASLRWPDHRHLAHTLLMASGAHAALVLLLYSQKIACIPCLLVAAGAFIATGASVALARPRRDNAIILFCAVLLVVFGVAFTLQNQARHALQERTWALVDQIEQEGPPVPQGHVRLVVYTRDGCRHCEDLKKKHLPPLAAVYGEKLTVDWRDAEDDLPTPTILVIGAEQMRVFNGLPEEEALTQAMGFAANGKEVW